MRSQHPIRVGLREGEETGSDAMGEYPEAQAPAAWVNYKDGAFQPQGVPGVPRIPGCSALLAKLLQGCDMDTQSLTPKGCPSGDRPPGQSTFVPSSLHPFSQEHCLAAWLNSREPMPPGAERGQARAQVPGKVNSESLRYSLVDSHMYGGGKKSRSQNYVLSELEASLKLAQRGSAICSKSHNKLRTELGQKSRL